jgi:hypothetical protein
MRRTLLAAALAVVTTVTGLAVAGPATAAARPRTPALPSAIEHLAPYVAQTSCDPSTKSGTANLANLLRATYKGIYAGTVYACGTDGTVSEHYDGRAIDWMASIRDKTQYADAKALLNWLLATDSHGNRFAIARRLGVQYLIYNNKIWGSWDGRWEDYNGCAKLTARSYDNSCHRTHVHISLSWNGAMGRTSFWTKHVYADDFGPCRLPDLNWAVKRSRVHTAPCRSYPKVKVPHGASSTKATLVKYSGATLRSGLTGPAVTAVQRALHAPVTGRYDSATIAALRRFQAARHLVLTYGLYPQTWRVLLKVTR